MLRQIGQVDLLDVLNHLYCNKKRRYVNFLLTATIEK